MLQLLLALLPGGVRHLRRGVRLQPEARLALFAGEHPLVGQDRLHFLVA